MSDEVDAIAAAWLVERPDLDVQPLHILSRISRLAQLLDARRAQAFAEHGLAGHEFDVLAALRRSGRPYERTPGQLIEATHVSSGTMTNRLDRLAERGLIVRKAHPDDGRQLLVRLTALGKRRVDAALETLLAPSGRCSAGCPRAQRRALAAGLRRLLHTLAGDEAHLGPRAPERAARADRLSRRRARVTTRSEPSQPNQQLRATPPAATATPARWCPVPVRSGAC